jgi:hypothetical protein
MLPTLRDHDSHSKGTAKKVKNFDLYQSAATLPSENEKINSLSLPNLTKPNEHDSTEKVKRMIFKALDDFQAEIKLGPKSPPKPLQSHVIVASPRSPLIQESSPTGSKVTSEMEAPVVDVLVQSKPKKVLRVRGKKTSDRARLAYILKAISKGMTTNPSALFRYDLTGVCHHHTTSDTVIHYYSELLVL